MPKLEKSGYKKYWPMKQLMGTGAGGEKHVAEVYRNMVTGESHIPVSKDGEFLGWNGEPPELLPGEKSPEANSKKYRNRFDMIKFDGGKLVNGKWIVGDQNAN